MNGKILARQVIDRKMWVLILDRKFCEVFLILIGIVRDMIENVCWS